MSVYQRCLSNTFEFQLRMPREYSYLLWPITTNLKAANEVVGGELISFLGCEVFALMKHLSQTLTGSRYSS
jgi:hypothetical protein